MQAEHLDGDRTFVIRGFLSPEECAEWIARSEAIGYADAPITTAVGFVMRKDVRNNERVIIDDPTLANAWWERGRDLLVPIWNGWQAVGLNERFRFYRYDIGQRFAKHTDGCFRRDDGDRSFFTFMVYLNDGFGGGATALYESDPALHVIPETGMALVFEHTQLHEGTAVTEGRKYVLRTDVMYRRLPR